jgi:hypothetical protein
MAVVFYFDGGVYSNFELDLPFFSLFQNIQNDFLMGSEIFKSFNLENLIAFDA